MATSDERRATSNTTLAARACSVYGRPSTASTRRSGAGAAGLSFRAGCERCCWRSHCARLSSPLLPRDTGRKPMQCQAQGWPPGNPPPSAAMARAMADPSTRSRGHSVRIRGTRADPMYCERHALLLLPSLTLRAPRPRRAWAALVCTAAMECWFRNAAKRVLPRKKHAVSVPAAPIRAAPRAVRFHAGGAAVTRFPMVFCWFARCITRCCPCRTLSSLGVCALAGGQWWGLLRGCTLAGEGAHSDRCMLSPWLSAVCFVLQPRY